jgi:hypothetical protein
MRGMTNTLTIGERVAWYRRRRGMSQEILAAIVGRTVDWLSKVENNGSSWIGCPSSSHSPTPSTSLSVTCSPSRPSWTGHPMVANAPFPPSATR